MMGVEPVYVVVIIATTVIAVAAGRNTAFEKDRLDRRKKMLLLGMIGCACYIVKVVGAL